MTSVDTEQGTWAHFPHGADMGVRGIGRSLETAFEEVALAMTAVVTEPEDVRATTEVEIACEAPDDEILLVDWLNALVFEMSTRRMLFSKFAVCIDNHRLQASAWGESIDPKRHHAAVEVKGATFTALRVAREEPHGGWLAQCVIDV